MGKRNLRDPKIKDVIHPELRSSRKTNSALVNNELSDYTSKHILYTKSTKEKEKEGPSSDSRQLGKARS